jgi:hypothetical protein
MQISRARLLIPADEAIARLDAPTRLPAGRAAALKAAAPTMPSWSLRTR